MYSLASKNTKDVALTSYEVLQGLYNTIMNGILDCHLKYITLTFRNL